jgi:hypothetical protein
VESTKEVCRKTGVQTNKVAHHHTTDCLHNLGFEGLNPYQISMLTNHILEKQLSADGSEAEWEVSTVHYFYDYEILLFSLSGIERHACGCWT